MSIQMYTGEQSSLMPLDLVCFSHLRWNFVFQRPQHLLSRYSKKYRLFYVEEPEYHDGPDQCQVVLSPEKVWVVTPLLCSKEIANATIINRHVYLLNTFFQRMKIDQYLFMYWTPMALKFTSHFKPVGIIYDCMDELSAFKFAPAELKLFEQEMFSKADLVFTGGWSLYHAKKNLHKNIHAFPSSIDKEHFGKARAYDTQPTDQAHIKGLKLGFFGVLDERLNRDLIAEVAKQKPEWQFILLGPVVKISHDDLPKMPNIHYLGGKDYKALPEYVAGWDIAMIPFEKNESTKYISPTKTPEYLAAGKPVISASIMDVVTPYADKKLVHIADNAEEFIKAVEEILQKTRTEKKQWLKNVDNFLADISWDNTWEKMHALVEEVLETKSVSMSKIPALKSVA